MSKVSNVAKAATSRSDNHAAIRSDKGTPLWPNEEVSVIVIVECSADE